MAISSHVIRKIELMKCYAHFGGGTVIFEKNTE